MKRGVCMCVCVRMCVTGGSELPRRVRKGLLREATVKLRFKDEEELQLRRQRKVRRVGRESKSRR